MRWVQQSFPYLHVENDPLFNLYVFPTLAHAEFSSVNQVLWRLISDLKLLSDVKGLVCPTPGSSESRLLITPEHHPESNPDSTPSVEQWTFFSLQHKEIRRSWRDGSFDKVLAA